METVKAFPAEFHMKDRHACITDAKITGPADSGRPQDNALILLSGKLGLTQKPVNAVIHTLIGR